MSFDVLRRARSSGWPGWWVPGARRSWRPSTAPADATAGSVEVLGRPMPSGSVAAMVRAGVGLAPEERKSQGLLLDQAVYRNITVSSLAASPARASSTTRAERRAAARADRVAGRTPHRMSPARPDPVRRQPAEGRAGAVAAAQVPGAAAGRADPRGRRRRANRDLRPDPDSWPTPASPSWSSPARSRRCSAWPTASWSSARAAVVHEGAGRPRLDESRVLDLVMEGTSGMTEPDRPTWPS